MRLFGLTVNEWRVVWYKVTHGRIREGLMMLRWLLRGYGALRFLGPICQVCSHSVHAQRQQCRKWQLLGGRCRCVWRNLKEAEV